MSQYISLDNIEIKKRRMRDIIAPTLGIPVANAQNSVRVTTGSVVLMMPLENGTNKFSASFDEKTTIDHKLEKKLKKGEMFLPCEIAMYIGKEYSGAHPLAGTTSPLFTYVEPEFFTGVDGNGVTEAASLMNLYLGATYNINQAQNSWWKHKCTNHLWYNPGRPFQTAAETGAAVDRPQELGPCCCGQGFWDLHNDYILVGDDDLDFCIELNACNPNTNIEGGFDDAGAAEESKNFAMVVLKGIFYCPTQQELGRCIV